VPCQPSDGGGGNDALSPKTVYHPREESAESSSISGRILPPLVCVTDAFCESGDGNNASSLEFSSVSSSHHVSSRTTLTPSSRFPGNHSDGSGVCAASRRMIGRGNYSVFSPSRGLEYSI